MGEKGLFVSLILIVVGTLTLTSSLMMEWQQVTLTAGLPLIRVSVGVVTAESTIWSAARSYSKDESWLSILHDMGTTKSLCAMRNDFCGGHAFAAIGALCFKVSMDYICGVAVLCIILVAMVAEMCGLGHLVFYYAKSPRKRHRLTAMYILNAGAFCACLSLVVYALDYMYAATAASPVITPFFYPGAGFAVAVVGTILVSIVPCCNQYWKIKKIEIVEPSKKDKGEAAFESLLDMPTWDRRQTGSFYHPPADFPSCVEMPTRQVLVNSTYITPAPQWNLASSTSSASLAGGWDYHPDYHGTYNC